MDRIPSTKLEQICSVERCDKQIAMTLVSVESNGYVEELHKSLTVVVATQI